MTIHPTEIDYPTSLVETEVPLPIDADPSSSFIPPGTTYVGIAAPKLFSHVAREPMGVSFKEGVVSPLEGSTLSALGLLLPATDHPAVLIGAGVPLPIDADPSSSFIPPGTTYVGIAAPKLFSHVAREPMGVSFKEGVVSPLEGSTLSALGLLLPATDHPAVLIGAGVPLPIDADPSSSFIPPGTTYFVLATIDSFSSGVVGEITQASYEETAVSLLEPSPLSKLLAQLETLQHTPEDERWPDAIWPDARAFADARTFISRLPLNKIPLPEITLADDGEVNFFWKSNGVHVDLGFYGTGTCSYFARGRDGRRLYGDATPASEGLPSEITALFTA